MEWVEWRKKSRKDDSRLFSRRWGAPVIGCEQRQPIRWQRSPTLFISLDLQCYILGDIAYIQIASILYILQSIVLK
jgi:hypothetical protein